MPEAQLSSVVLNSSCKAKAEVMMTSVQAKGQPQRDYVYCQGLLWQQHYLTPLQAGSNLPLFSAHWSLLGASVCIYRVDRFIYPFCGNFDHTAIQDSTWLYAQVLV